MEKNIFSLAKDSVRDGDNINFDETVEKFRLLLNEYLNDQVNGDAQIGTALDDVFNTHRGASISLNYTTTLVFQRLGHKAELFPKWKKRIENYIHSRKDYAVKTGKGNGVFRIADRVEK